MCTEPLLEQSGGVTGGMFCCAETVRAREYVRFRYVYYGQRLHYLRATTVSASPPCSKLCRHRPIKPHTHTCTYTHTDMRMRVKQQPRASAPTHIAVICGQKGLVMCAHQGHVKCPWSCQMPGTRRMSLHKGQVMCAHQGHVKCPWSCVWGGGEERDMSEKAGEHRKDQMPERHWRMTRRTTRL